jgi:D-threo-aldose 1-dehydrogenase
MSIRDKLISGPLGFGSAPLDNMFRNIPAEDAAATVDAAWQQGIRYFDTAPLYGAGLSEMRLGRALAKHKREEYVLSAQVGRLILDEVASGRWHLAEKGNPFEFGRQCRRSGPHRPGGATAIEAVRRETALHTKAPTARSTPARGT